MAAVATCRMLLHTVTSFSSTNYYTRCDLQDAAFFGTVRQKWPHWNWDYLGSYSQKSKLHRLYTGNILGR
jgi:hypothetical protein